MTDEEKQLRREQCLSRHDSIRTQANIQLLNERINLIGSLKAHREHCQYVSTKLNSVQGFSVAPAQTLLTFFHTRTCAMHIVQVA